MSTPSKASAVELRTSTSPSFHGSACRPSAPRRGRPGRRRSGSRASSSSGASPGRPRRWRRRRRPAPIRPSSAVTRSVAEPERLVDGEHGGLDLVLGDHDRHPDRRGRDHLDVDARRPTAREHLGGDARVGLHAGADQRDLGDVLVDGDARGADLVGERLEDAARLVGVAARQGERDVGRPSSETFWTIMSMLMFASASAENSRAATPGCPAPLDGELGLRGVVGDTGDDRVLHLVLLGPDPGAGRVAERRADVDAHAVVAAELDRPDLQDAGALRGQLEHLLVGDPSSLRAPGRCAGRR
jgi:hypothetical protein